ncbi:hypothetical protein KOAAANKH_02624 [Brevundimonas sp. NIBR10]|nr:hypothetical protein KOAAANKH_02624 [Brevundimonas sp. NIBR10]
MQVAARSPTAISSLRQAYLTGSVLTHQRRLNSRGQRMRPLLFAITALVIPSCSTPPSPVEQRFRAETVRLEPAGELSLRAGYYVDVSGFSFAIGFDNHATDLSNPKSVTWSIGFRNYCRNRDSWVQSVVTGPSGQVWRGYRVFVPAGPEHPQHWSSGGNGSDRYGGPATPGILDAAAEGGRFVLAVEDDEGQRWNAVNIDTLTPEVRNRLFAKQAGSEPRETQMLVVAPPQPLVPNSRRSCPV